MTQEQYDELVERVGQNSALKVSSATITLARKKTITAANVASRRPRKKTNAEIEYGQILRLGNPGAEVIYEAYTLKLAPDTRYTPDYAVIYPVSLMIDFHEVKGRHIFAKALNKPKIAAAMFPHHRFFLATKKIDGTFDVRLLPSE